MTPALRPGIEISPLPEGLQLTDTATGFAVELEPEYASLLEQTGPEAEDFWKSLTDMGLVDTGLEIPEIRRRQRNKLLESHPPLLERLRERLTEIRARVPFFRERAGQYDPERLQCPEDLASFPFLRKRDLREHFPNGLIPDDTNLAQGLEDGTATLLATSGSTDERLQVAARVEIDRHPFGCDDLYGVPIGGKQPRTAVFTTPVCTGVVCHLGSSPYEERLRKVYPDLMLNSTDDPFAIQPWLIDSFCEEIERFQPQILMADAIYLQCLIRRARELGARLPRVPFIQYGFEFGHRAAVRDIQREFGVPALNEYGATEENRIALECHRGSLHVRADVVHFEIVNADGPCPPGVVGAVALTTFDTLTPLVRYLIGDAAAWAGKKCDCAFADWPTIELHGRLKDMMRAGGRWISTLDIDKAIGAPDWLDFYRVIQHGPERFEAQVIPAPGAAPDFEDLAERLSRHLDPRQIEFRTVSRFDPLKSMKIGLTQTRLGGAPEIP
jgi:phenylacetate-CoA ligase